MTKMQVFSSGGGSQSSAIIALILQNKLPKPDVVIMADTGREKQATWDYMQQVTGPALSSIGIEVHIARASELATVDLYSSKGSVLMPMWTNQSGKVGRLPTYCSNEWKRRVVQRYLRRNLEVKECDLWLGISSDEVERVRTSQEQWMEHVFPLVGIVNFDSHPKLFMSRSDCYAAVRDMGWPDPPKSSCWMCPHMGNAQWKQQKELAPEEFERAVQLEKEIQALDPNAFLHLSGKPLDQVDFYAQGSLFEDEQVTCTSTACWL